MDDQISRQEAIKIIKNYCENGCDIAEDNWCPSCQREQFIKLLEALPSVQAEQKKEKWTALNKDDPATFPEEFVCVWVTGKNNCVEIAKLSDRGYWLDTDEDYMASRDWVTAWMPFEYPEPYGGDDE